MKIKEWFKTFFAGMAIGVSSSIPGVSGGTIAVILKVYERLLWSISNLFKAFKKAIIYLVPILLGVIVAMIPTMYLMDKALNGFLFAIVSLFAGFIIGSIPGITDEVKGTPIKKSHIIALVASLLLAVGLGIASVLAKADVTSLLIDPKWWVYLILIPVGFIASIALVVPGLSGGMLLLLLGFYKPLISSTVDVAKECLTGDWSNFGHQIGILACFGVGVIIGFYIISKIMHFLLSKYRVTTFYAIIGFVIGSTIALYFNYEIYEYYVAWSTNAPMAVPMYIEIPVGVILLIVGLIGSYMLVRYKRKQPQQEVKENDAN